MGEPVLRLASVSACCRPAEDITYGLTKYSWQVFLSTVVDQLGSQLMSEMATTTADSASSKDKNDPTKTNTAAQASESMHEQSLSDSSEKQHVASHDDLEKSAVVTLLAVTFKEAALDSPTFRTSVNHVNEQLENLDRWLESFSKALNRLSQEMDGKCLFCLFVWGVDQFI